MKSSITSLVSQVSQGQFQLAAHYTAQLKATEGSQPDAAVFLAKIAASKSEPRLLSLAFALWPEALGLSCHRFVTQLGPQTAQRCAKLSPELHHSIQSQLAEWVLKEEREQVARQKKIAKELALKSAKEEAFKVKKTAPCWRITQHQTATTPQADVASFEMSSQTEGEKLYRAMLRASRSVNR